MWLLHTETGKLRNWTNPPEKYAILSHVWQKNEQTFQEVMALQGQPDLLSAASAKIRDCCAFARKHGYDWVWVDTCCIDKTSSAELSEAINSMFDWYAGATECFAFLEDVGDDSQMHRSKWFRRGWTLQELLAPRHVLFLSSSWSILGTKMSLASQIERITGIDVRVLQGRTPLAGVAVAERMSWAARRRTTRVEDRAYSLLGIFGVKLPAIYGEGARAFLRLQEEILKHSPDQTIFAWDHDEDFRTSKFLDSSGSLPPTSELLADSPDRFARTHIRGIQPITLSALSARLGMHLRDSREAAGTAAAVCPVEEAP
ncbi:heterokaryon incompatibility protein-domain-containing protein [Trametes elegans]|nr:heterokaryon incompatibility protein-domain-containing protein [Trametes elegans]